MKIHGLFAVAHVADMKRAEPFYTALVGRQPDNRPMDGLVQWQQEDFGIQLVRDAEKAGRSAITIVTPDLARARGDLAARGLDLEPEIQGDFGRIAQIADPEGNRITLAEPPTGM